MDTSCTYRGNRDETLIAYLYDAIEPVERASFDAHLASCHICRLELDELGQVRAQLAGWTPPEPAAGWRSDRTLVATAGRGSWGAALGEMPVWAQVAAAMLVVGVAAGAANLHITYSDDGLSVRTGWLLPAAGAPAAVPAAPSAVPVSNSDSAPWRVELAALEQQLRSELTPANAQTSPKEHDAASDAALLRRVRALIDESEKKQRTELALRVGEVANFMRSQRVADLGTIDRNLKVIQTSTGADIYRLYQAQQDLANRVALVH
jgi:hypothetical protein